MAVAVTALWHLGWGTNRGCPAAEWSAEEAVLQLPPGTFLRNPITANDGSVEFVGGKLAGGRGGAALPALLMLRGGVDIGAPAGDFSFREPHVAVDGQGVLHLVWAETTRTDDPADAPKRSALPVSIWHAAFADGHWSAAERVHVASGEGQRFWWIPKAPAVAIDSADRLHVIVPGAGAGMLHLSLDFGLWSVDTIADAAVRTALAAGSQGELYLVYVGRQAGSNGRSELVKVRRSQDDGLTWAPAEAVRGGRPAYGRVEALLDGTGGLHVLFGVLNDDPFHPAILRQTVSRNGGQSWTRPRDLGIPPQRFTEWSTGLDACGNEQVIVYAWDTSLKGMPAGRLLRSQIKRQGWFSGWSPLRALPAGRILREAEMARGPNGGLNLLFSRELEPGGPGMPRYMLARKTLPGHK